MKVSLLPPGHPAWYAEIERCGLELGAPDNPTLFPYHFLTVVLQRIGGQIVVVENEHGGRLAWGFLFPRQHTTDRPRPNRVYTLRYHAVPQRPQPHPDELVAAVVAELQGDEVVFYDPLAPKTYAPSYAQIGVVNVGRPSAAEAEAIRDAQRCVWGSPPEFLYPMDMHSTEFHLGTSLIARVDSQPAGFLFGLYKFGGAPLPADWGRRFHADLRLESQTMAVLPAYRGMRIGNLLKRMQAEQAWHTGIGIVHWTVDPLQYPNAALNFGLLRAVAFDFHPDLYPFRNDLNRVHASRFAITWLVGSRRVRNVPMVGGQATVLDLHRHRNVARVNRGWTDVNYTLENQLIAIEVPAAWTELQSEDLEAAVQWRDVSDRVFAHYVGCEPGRYVITGVGIDGDRRYLIGERVDDALWERLGME